MHACCAETHNMKFKYSAPLSSSQKKGKVSPITQRCYQNSTRHALSSSLHPNKTQAGTLTNPNPTILMMFSGGRGRRPLSSTHRRSVSVYGNLWHPRVVSFFVFLFFKFFLFFLAGPADPHLSPPVKKDYTPLRCSQHMLILDESPLPHDSWSSGLYSFPLGMFLTGFVDAHSSEKSFRIHAVAGSHTFSEFTATTPVVPLRTCV